MNDRSNEKKLVQAFKTFFQKSISPYVYTNENILNEWKYFSRLISSDPIDYSQIQFYLLLANKSNTAPQSPQIDYRNSGYGQNLKYNQTLNQPIATKLTDSDKKSSNSKQLISPKKYSLQIQQKKFSGFTLKLSGPAYEEPIEIVSPGKKGIPQQSDPHNQQYHECHKWKKILLMCINFQFCLYSYDQFGFKPKTTRIIIYAYVQPNYNIPLYKFNMSGEVFQESSHGSQSEYVTYSPSPLDLTQILADSHQALVPSQELSRRYQSLKIQREEKMIQNIRRLNRIILYTKYYYNKLDQDKSNLNQQ